jgi:hypothetical protein
MKKVDSLLVLVRAWYIVNNLGLYYKSCLHNCFKPVLQMLHA